MKNNKILIERVANGWIVRPLDFSPSNFTQPNEIFVFNSIVEIAASLHQILALPESDDKPTV